MDTKALTAKVAAHAHGRVPRDLRREQVLAEAAALFIERGYQGASMDELARRVGVTKPLVYDLVGSKEALFREVMASVQQDLTACVASAVAAERELSGRLHAGILAFLRFVHQHRKGWAALLSSGAGPVSAEAVALRREQVGLVAGLIGASLGPAGARLDGRTLEALAQAVNGAVEFVALWWQDQPGLTAEELADLLTKLLSPGLDALSRRAPTRRKQRAR